MRRAIAGLIAVGAWIALVPILGSYSAADECGQRCTTAESSAGGFAVSSTAAVQSSSANTPTEVSSVDLIWNVVTCADQPGSPLCVLDAFVCPEANPLQSVTAEDQDGAIVQSGLDCAPDEAAAVPQLTDAVVSTAFARIPLPAAELQIQPPGGRTLVNFDTNFFTTDDEPFTRTVRLLGRRVELRITPASFSWVWGDGSSETTSSPGAAYPDLEITHRYLVAVAVRPRLDTTYTATWRVGAQPFRAVPGSVTITGEPESLDVRTARPKLVPVTTG